jgi:bacterial/archaeal transporter family protein
MYALLAAFFAALTAIFAKVEIKGVDTGFATAIRTIVILIISWAIALLKSGTCKPAIHVRKKMLLNPGFRPEI